MYKITSHTVVFRGIVLLCQEECNILYLFVYEPTSAISRDPKVLSVLIGEVFKTCKLKILGYK